MAKTTKNKKAVKVKLLYMGRREINDSIAHAFRHGEKTVYFAKAKFCIIGYEYYAEKVEGNLLVSNPPETVGQEYKASPAEISEWEIADAVSDASRKRRLFYNRIRREKNLGSEFEKLRAMTKGLSYSEKRIFADFLVEQMTERNSK